jgi:uroporphyrin-III C-methyltransferase / precorrin-2 dehydrogenase / sirohydrochlorin ferrochelatase
LENLVKIGTFVATGSHQSASIKSGSLVLVGAGPGDPELLTLKAVRVLKTADVVLYDDLVSDEVLSFASPEAELIHVGKRGGKPSCKQSDICEMAIAYALNGKRVIRLKGGDPMVFGRADEELRAAEAANIPVEIVSGVTTAFGAAASLQLSLTKRGVARKLQFVTAHARDGKLPSDLDFAALVDKTATTCIYMGVKTLPPLVASLLAFGMARNTPIIIVENATCANEYIMHGTLETILEQATSYHFTGPCLIILGEAMRART